VKTSVRQHFTKHSDSHLTTNKQAKMAIEKLNNRPRKRCQFNSPNEVYLQKTNNNQAFYSAIDSA
jgi:IS30 family transposase